ncbi:MAG TPA: alpha/beta hydrolase-fold protein [Chitinophagaceae bacterium]|nr:alpha/beta hydrolase-fold protein [Chitinophagaceae bacterium]
MTTRFKIWIRPIGHLGISALCIMCVPNDVAAQSYPEVTIPGSQTRKITSISVPGQEYVLQISLPGGYQNSNKKYPVLYLMDSQWDFPLATALYGEQYYDGFIPEIIVVGITWGGIHPNPDSLRARDYTPTRQSGVPQSGGADQFLSFMKNEVFPLIETNYKADKNERILMGSSLGGLFALYTLFTQPAMFNKYVAASPAYGWDNQVIYQFEKKYFEKKSNPPARVFMCIGGVESNVPGFQALTKSLSDHAISSLQIESRILENTGHSGTKGEGYARGLQFVFKRPALKLSSAVLDKYVGGYQFNDGTSVDVRKENGILIAYSHQNRIVLYAASENDFYSTAGFINVHFKKDERGNVSGFQLDRYGSNEFVKRK